MRVVSVVADVLTLDSHTGLVNRVLTFLNMLKNSIGQEQAGALCAVQAAHPNLKTLCGLDPNAKEVDVLGKAWRAMMPF